MLGANEQHTYKKAELKSFLQFHRTGEEPLRDDEITILNGVLELNNRRVDQIMTPIKVGCRLCFLMIGCFFLKVFVQDVVVLSADTILDHSTVDSM